MKFNSQICTTKEQSERLLDLGLKIETADMAYEYKPKHLADTDLDKDWVIVAHSPCGTDIPAWSLHRLIEILPKEVDIDGFRFPLRSDAIHRLSEVSSIYDTIIGIIERTVEMGHLNQGYLEE